MIADKGLRCDCGHEVRASDEADLVEAIRRHAWETHEIEFSVELALDVIHRARLAPEEGQRLEDDGVGGKEKQ